jgi:hypothetical protein
VRKNTCGRRRGVGPVRGWLALHEAGPQQQPAMGEVSGLPFLDEAVTAVTAPERHREDATGPG